jgi:type IV secretory pathway VirB2 component (pilin)
MNAPIIPQRLLSQSNMITSPPQSRLTEEIFMNRRSLKLVKGLPIAALALSTTVYAQANPFAQGASAFQTSLISILTPVATIAVMVIGVAAWFNRVSWSWAAASGLGILLVFGAPQVVQWLRSMAGV